MDDHPVSAAPTVGAITPSPSPEEVAAIVAAVDALWPRPVVEAQEPASSPAWRFSGRWWRKPVAARRDRPW